MTQSNESNHGQSSASAADFAGAADVKVTLRGPGELADALPYLMGFHPNDSVVMVALHGEYGRFGGRLRVGLPQDAEEWPELAAQLADCLVRNSMRRGLRPDAVVVFLCQDPCEGERSSAVMERLRPLAQFLRVACGDLEVPVVEALCVSAGRWWSYCSPGAVVPGEGTPLPPPGSTTMAATAAYAGLPAPTSQRDIESRLRPPQSRNREHEIALDIACAELLPRMLADREGERIRGRTVALARAALEKFRSALPIGDPVRGDRRDDKLLRDDEAAAIILGLQDKQARDRVAEWMEPGQADAALRLWRALARRCPGPYGEHAAAPLSLAGWVAWSSGDEAEARVALAMALDLEPDYGFARLLHTSVNEGLDPELLRRSLRHDRRRRVTAAAKGRRGPDGPAGRGPGRHSPGDRRVRTRR
ncbi:DUF4192 domain-containing protein [Actinacidiphila acididurans]|uniref:DUF4192 domain-containing protein n=1 Tax=Actinacidiphila acididurans TaxID=2784346 RepID=A0ABS2TV41_9ACTN|nr:DUF4192 domain-containing protein [Actinacidiphila acididurans]MBM9507205.1 DUF4192 domain-containing protein [Actinacidiphila acididurans]